MPIDKNATIDVTPNTITVTVTITVTGQDVLSYPADSAMVTAKRLPNGNPESIPLKTPGAGTAVFEKGGLAVGGYNVVVECSQTTFSRVVDVASTARVANMPNNTVTFTMNDKNPAQEFGPW